MRARVTSETVPPPFRTLLVVWKLTPARAATSLTETCLAGLRDATLRLLCAGSERSPSDLVGGRMEPRSEYPRPRFRRPDWINLNGEWEFGAGERPTFDRRINVPFCPESKLSGIAALPGDTVWYRRRFDAPAGDCFLLHFGAVDFEVAGNGDVKLTVTLDGDVVGAWSGAAGRGRIALESVAAWHPDSPTLYDVEATLLDGDGKIVDRVLSYFGLRTVGTSDGRVWLNGEPFVQRLVLDQGYFPDGLLTAPSDDALRADIEAAKALGFNGARKHQKVEDPRWLYWADRLGFLVWDEMPSFQEHSGEAERRLASEWTEVVRRDRDHPCVVAWVPANESFGLEHIEPPVRSRFLVRLYDLTRELDGSRPVVSNDGCEHDVTDLCSLHDYCGPDDFARRYRGLELILDGQASGHQPYDPGFAYRGEPVLVTEFRSEGRREG